ncbi:MAG: hypothetical protein MUP30_10850, partial [Deltaproteobacteria bacterium]|nr:hypothetical protein [Deltaproteobacteria bacterium]
TLLKIFDFEKGRAITAFPLDIDPEEAKDFEDGILPEPPKSEWRRVVEPDGSQWIMIPKPNMDFWLASTIRMYLTIEDKRLCIFENALASPSDPWIPLKKSQIFTFKDEVYHFLLSSDVSGKKIEQTLRDAASHRFIGVMTSVPRKTSFPKNGHEISFEELKVFVERSEKIIVGAYDGEGYLIWKYEAERP